VGKTTKKNNPPRVALGDIVTLTEKAVAALDEESFGTEFGYSAIARIEQGEYAYMERPLYGCRVWHVHALRHWKISEAKAD
jgi:hypothetical protein